DARDPRRGRLPVEIGQNGRTDQCADESRPREDPDRAPIDVAELVVGDAGDQGRSQFGEVHRRRGGRRCRTRREQQSRRGYPIGHAEGSVDELSDEADEAENDELTHALAFLETLQAHTLPKVLSKNPHQGFSYELGRQKSKDDIERRNFPSEPGLGASSAVGYPVRMTENEAAWIDQGDYMVEQ